MGAMKKDNLKYDVLARMLWYLFSGGFFRHLKVKLPELNLKKLKRKSKVLYKEILLRTPSIGGMKENGMTMALVWGAMVIAIYKAGEGEITSEILGTMISTMADNPIFRAANKKEPFNEVEQKKREVICKKSQERRFAYDWVSEFEYGDTFNEFRVTYYQCGLCKLAQQEKCRHIVKEMCKFDYITAQLMGAKLVRTETIAEGGDMCDFRYQKKG